MKELSIEEKAKAYDEAIEKFEVILNLSTVKESGTIFADDVRKIFPALAESEDEKIRKRLISYFKSQVEANKDGNTEVLCTYNKWIAYLEKQGEHANFRNKIQIGDKVTRNTDGVLVNLSQLERIAKKDKKQGEQKPYGLRDECKDCQCNYAGECKGSCVMKRNEQKSDKIICNPDTCMYVKNYRDIQKTAWSEKDEAMLTLVKVVLSANKDDERFAMCDTTVEDCFNWFKSLKDRIQPQNTTVTDEELIQAKKDAYNDALDKIEYHSGKPTFDDGWSAAIWYLKKRNAQPQPQWKPSDGQMDAITCAVRRMKESACYNSELVHLLQDLKKLREE